MKINIDERQPAVIRNRQATKKLADVQTANDENEARIRDIYTKIHALRSNPSDTKIEAAALALLNSDESSDLKEHMSVLANELDQRIAKRPIFEKAVKMQKHEVEKTICDFSTSVCEPIVPRHAEIVRRRAELALEIAKLNSEERALLLDLEAAGVNIGAHLRPMYLNHIGFAEDKYAGVFFHIKEIYDHFPSLRTKFVRPEI
jgi:hypothetical protein